MDSAIFNRSDNSCRISAVIPAYNREKTIRRCIDSVVNQTVQPYEIIVVDDGSSDGTLEILEKEYSDKVRLIRQNHRGAQAARNLGILNAEGDYIAFLDSDDEWLPDKLELQIKVLQKNRDAVIYGDYYVQTDWAGQAPKVYKSTIKRTKAGTRKICRVNGKSGYIYDEILRNSYCLFPMILTSKSNLIGIGLLDENVPSFQEWDTAIRLAKKCEFVYINKPFFVYHLHDGETISKSPKKEIDGLEYIYKKFEKEATGRFGNRETARRYKMLAKRCVKYRDIRLFKYFIKYAICNMDVRI